MKFNFYKKIIDRAAMGKSRLSDKRHYQYLVGSLGTFLFVMASCAVVFGQGITTYPRSGWTVTANSEKSGFEATKLIDASNSTFWSSQDGAGFNHTLVFDMGVSQPVNQIYYVQQGTLDNAATKGFIDFSDNGIAFDTEKTFVNFSTGTAKTIVAVPLQTRRYFRITITENRVTRDFPEDHNASSAMADVGAMYDTNLSALLTSFTTQSTNLGVAINWTSAAELGTGIYTIQRSVDGLNGFTTIPGVSINVVAKTTPTNYTLTDLFPVTGTAFYRLVRTGGTTQNSRPAYAEFPLVNYVTDKPKNLNIFYFIPSDLAAPDDFKNRMDDIMLGLQTYFKNEMIRNGRTANSTFGMFTDDATHTRAKLIVINGKFPKSGYPRDDASPILAEVEAYIAANPSPLYGAHNLIMLPAYSIDYTPSVTDPDGVFLQGPFSGQGKNCYAMDYDQMKQSNLGLNTRDGRNSVKFIGGMAHELGHGLGLDHNDRKVSETALGTLLMNVGNYTYGASTTSLSAADAAILNDNQIFNNDGNTLSYYGPVNASLTSVSACYNPGKNSIIITGHVSSTGSPVTDIAIYNDPDRGTDFAGVGDNLDYDAVTWSAPVDASGNFYIEELVNELKIKSNSLYEMKVKLIQQDGNIGNFKYSYTFPGPTLPDDQASVPVMNYAVYTPPAGGVTGPTLTPVSFSIQATAGPNGTISPIGAVPVSCVASQTFTITPGATYVIDQVLVDGVARTVTNGQVQRTTETLATTASYTFTDVKAAHSISVTFKLNPMPVTLTTFKAELKGKNNALLAWATTEETNNEGFDIELSTDARQFVKVGFVEGKGESKSLKEYSYIVSELAAGTYYFRLKQLDYDGKFEYSQIRNLVVATSDDLLSVYPNPTSSKLRFNPSMHQNQSFSIQVANQAGKIVLSLPASTSYTNGYELDASALASGLYHIVIQGANFTENLRFVKL